MRTTLSLLVLLLVLGRPGFGQEGEEPDEGGTADPASFDVAWELYRQMRSTAENTLRKAVEAAEADADKQTAQENLDRHVDEMLYIGRVGLGRANNRDNVADIQLLRYYMCYEFYRTGRYERAGLIGNVLGRELAKDDAKTAQQAAYIAMISFQRMYSAADAEDRDFEVDRVVEAASLIADTWPAHQYAESARLVAAGTLFANGDAERAAEWYAKVPETSPKYVEAQLVGGRAAHTAYAKAAARTGDDALTPEERQAKLDDARTRLTTGVQRTEADLKPDDATPSNLVYGKYALAQILISDGEYQQALDLLVGKPHSVHPATVVAEGEQRPASGLKGIPFATAVEQMLLRTYVGMGNLDDAQAVVARLELLGGGGSGSVSVYVNLGRQLREELLRLNAADETEKLAQLATAFDTLLAKLLERSSELDANTTRWIGTTYDDIGAALPSGGETYARKAAAVFDGLIRRAASDPSFLTDSRLLSIRLLRAKSLQTAGDTDGALDAVGNVLAKKSTALNAQETAAEILAAKGQDDPDSLLLAINGTTRGSVKIWGFAGIARRLESLAAKEDASETLVASFRNAKYQSAALRHQFAKSLTGADRERGLKRVRTEIVLFSRIGGDLDEETWERFDALYKSIQTDLGETPVALPRPESPAAPDAEEDADDDLENLNLM